MLAGAATAVGPLKTMLSQHAAVAAVTIVGSQSAGVASDGSDIDLFVYAEDDLRGVREEAADTLADHSATVIVGESTFGSADAWRLRDGPWVDVMFWSPSWAEEQLRRLVDEHQASLGYTTAFWRSIARGHPVFERDDWHPQLQERARTPYPTARVDAVVALNLPRLGGHPFSFLHQVETAAAAQDTISVNHRTAAWLASYFDVLFAINRVLHPGEKRIMHYVHNECALVPMHLDDHIGMLAAKANPSSTLAAMLEELKALLDHPR